MRAGDETPPAGAAGAVAGRPLLGWIEEFLTARAPRKPSEHTVAAYRRDLVGVARIVAEQAGTPLARLALGQLDTRSLRAGFAAYAVPRSPASVARAWSVWNQLFDFLVDDDAAAGNPMRGVDRPRLPRRSPKLLTCEDTPERLLAAVAAGLAGGRDPWSERDLLVLALGLVGGLRLAEMIDLTVGSLAGRAGERRLQVTGKGRKPHSIPVEAPLEALVEAYLASRRCRFPGWRPAAGGPVNHSPAGRPGQPGREPWPP